MGVEAEGGAVGELWGSLLGTLSLSFWGGRSDILAVEWYYDGDRRRDSGVLFPWLVLHTQQSVVGLSW